MAFWSSNHSNPRLWVDWRHRSLSCPRFNEYKSPPCLDLQLILTRLISGQQHLRTCLQIPFLSVALGQWSLKLWHVTRDHIDSFPLQDEMGCSMARRGWKCVLMKESPGFHWEGAKDSPHCQVCFFLSSLSEATTTWIHCQWVCAYSRGVVRIKICPRRAVGMLA